jgi:hypothetical protein
MGNQNHEHQVCKHENLKWCEKCDLIYCLNPDCKKEWKHEAYSYTWTQPCSTGTTFNPAQLLRYY